MLLVLAIAPLVLGITRKVKARLLRRIGPPLWQPYLDLWKLMHKEAVLAHNASWIYRAAPYFVFAVTWVAAALVPTYATNLMFSWSADLIATGGAAGDRPLRAGARRHGRRHGVRRHRLVARDDDRLAGGAGDAAGGVHRRADRRHHAALGHRRDLRDCRRSGCACRSAWRSAPSCCWRSPRMRASRSTIRRRILNSPWCTRRWCWNIPAGTSP